MADAAFLQRLRAIFGEEANEHLGQIDAALVALEQGPQPPGEEAVQQVLRPLHTLKGAARAVDEEALELLCHELEGVLAAALGRAAVLTAEQFDRLHQGAAIARAQALAPGARNRNQALACAAQLASLATQLGATPAPAPAKLAGTADPADQPAEPARAAAPDTSHDRIRVQGKSIDAIRGHAEALLPVELQLHHHLEALRDLAQGMAAQRKETGAAGAGADIGRFELACNQLASRLARTGAELRATRTRLLDATLETALVPFEAVADELPALVRKLGRSHGRQVELELRGASVAIDRRLLPVLRETLIHLVTNAADHGIEAPEQRRAAGKPDSGRITVAVVQRDARQVSVRISDDGAGIDTEALARVAGQRCGLDPAQLAQMSEQQRLQLALRAGVSTREEVTQVSGRGMGLAIVAERVAAAGGQLLIESSRGAGTMFELLLPVGVTNVRALVVAAGGLRYALPLAGLDAVQAAGRAAIRTVEGRETILDGGRVLPLVRLASLLWPGQDGADGAAGVVLLARVGAQDFGILVDEVVAEQDVLPKRLGPLLRRVRYISAAAQLGDGTLVPVLALEDIATHGLAGGAPGVGNTASAPAAAARVLVVEDSATSRLLLKHILEGAGFAVDTAVDGLDALSRLRGTKYEAVVSDVEMPNLNGLDLTSSIRANPQTVHLPIVLVTSLQTSAEREAGLRAGADAYFTKGAFDQDRLLATVRRLAGSERA
ncbi:response regulator [Massilia sp. 2TAF26]|uniref:hybrid sensor histidine kinase/response regulator n=1 Tax=Massilia sp. 2TAF26 TaxID=3233012 RepID=UPI003F94ABFD